jgi:hypothetical protein
MLERLSDAPDRTIGLKASGTVMAQDIEDAIAGLSADLGASAAAGVIVEIDHDFDGYFAELARGLTSASLAHRTLVKLAVVMDGDRLNEARLSGFDRAAAPVRLFVAADRMTAFSWAAAARRGE